MTTTATPRRRGKRLARGVEAALCCGILAPLLSVAVDRVAGALWHGYSLTARSASELTAAGAPTRAYVLALSLASDVLLVIFVLTVLGLTVQSTPHLGLQERTNGYLYLLWVLVLACVLLRSEARNASRHQKEVPQS